MDWDELEHLQTPWFEVRRASAPWARLALAGMPGAALIMGADALMEMRRPPAAEPWRWGGFKAGAFLSSREALTFVRQAWGAPDAWRSGRYRKAADFVFETPDVVIHARIEPGERGNTWSAALKAGAESTFTGGLSTEMASQWDEGALAQLGMALSQIALAAARANPQAAQEMARLAPGWMARAILREADDPALSRKGPKP